MPMFSYVDAVALTKCDLKEAVGFDGENFLKGLRRISQAQGVNDVANYLRQKYEEM